MASTGESGLSTLRRIPTRFNSSLVDKLIFSAGDIKSGTRKEELLPDEYAGSDRRKARRSWNHGLKRPTPSGPAKRAVRRLAAWDLPRSACAPGFGLMEQIGRDQQTTANGGGHPWDLIGGRDAVRCCSVTPPLRNTST